eukprot:CAMPEP_0119101736 /NCGR_PEP_ID=MMETSP1180-20130426/706_1 /TAXON_ID=3052 ORGANISM="Chlamydomonas cf sp, Strain CCMP681" /NCGR_SAMPLE_ID=MMETSP1180 /ASSEMBLY_ACC=CAM_ASM_000741 /LENGTH=82 /DNA_ID=CAMNT_0007085903 /DNA_START=387 /DNA_END=635 /DNA_ORIENTATION=+
MDVAPCCDGISAGTVRAARSESATDCRAAVTEMFPSAPIQLGFQTGAYGCGIGVLMVCVLVPPFALNNNRIRHVGGRGLDQV